MKIFISDLHLGDGTKTEDFYWDSQFLKFLDYAEGNCQELVILGDLLELWQSDLSKVLFAHHKVISRLLSLKEKIKLTYVIGNHDYIPFIKVVGLNLGVALEYRHQDEAIVAEHGHRYDIFNRYRNPLRSVKWPAGKYFSLFLATLERFVHPDIDRWTRKMLDDLDEFSREAAHLRNKVTPATADYIKRGGHFLEFDQAVQNHLASGAKLVVFGHTHKAQIKKFDKGIYANCGAWTEECPTYVAYEKNKVELREAFTHKVIEQANN